MTRQDDVVQPDVHLGAQLDRIAEELKALARVHEALRELFRSVLGRDVGLHVVLRQIVATAVALVDTQLGAVGVLSEDGDHFVEFVPIGLTAEEEAAAAPLVGSPRERALLGHLMTDPRPLRVDSVSEHPISKALPPGLSRVHTLLGAAIRSRGHTHGILYVSNRCDGRPFDEHDEAMIGALADAAGLAIDDARLFGKVRSEAEEFQRLLLPRLPDLRPIEAAAVYRPATPPGFIGRDWYDAMRLPDGSCAVVVGDTGGHGLPAAAAMAQTRSMLRALLYQRPGSPGAVLAQLDRTLQATTATPLTTACVARLRRGRTGWRLCWSTAGHPAPLLLVPGKPGRYLDAEPGLPLGIDPSAARPGQRHRLPGGATVVFFTDGLVEHHKHPIDEGLATLAKLAAQHASQPAERLCQALAGHHPGDGSDDMAILALRLPARQTRHASRFKPEFPGHPPTRADLGLYASVAIAVAGALIATPDGTLVAWHWITGASNWVRDRLARFLPFLRRKISEEAKQLADSGSATDRLTVDRRIEWNTLAPEDKIELLHQQVELLLQQVVEVRQEVRDSEAALRVAIEQAEVRLRDAHQKLTGRLEAKERRAARVDAPGIWPIGFGIVLTGLPGELAGVAPLGGCSLLQALS